MEEYRSEFEAPCHTVLDTRFVGNQVVRLVMMDGVIQEFTVSRALNEAGQRLARRQTVDPTDGTI